MVANKREAIRFTRARGPKTNACMEQVQVKALWQVFDDLERGQAQLKPPYGTTWVAS